MSLQPYTLLAVLPSCRLAVLPSCRLYAIALPFHPGIERIAETIAEEIEGQHGQRQCEGGGDEHVRIGAEIGDRFGDHQPPAWHRRPRAKSQEADARLIDDGLRDADGRGDDDD